MYATTMTQKGQVTIPAPIRKKLGLKRGEKVSFEEKEGQVIIKLAPSLRDLMGSLKTTKKYDKDKVKKTVGQYLAKRYEKTLS